MSDGTCPTIYQPIKQWNPVQVELANGQKATVGYVVTPEWKEAHSLKPRPAKPLPAGGYNRPCVLERRK